MSVLLDRVFMARCEWAKAHGDQWPTVVYLSPLATARALRATCGMSAVRPELVDLGDTGGQQWTVKRFAHDVLQMDWCEDTRMTGETFRFAMAVVESALTPR